MPPKYHTFKLSSRITPSEVLRILNLVKDHKNQKDYKPDFEFDWIKRKLVLSANSQEGVDVLIEQFKHQINRQKLNPSELFLIGKTVENESRFQAPIGVMMQDPATFGEMIGNSLVDIGVRGITVIDRADHCLISVQLGPFTGNVDFQSFIQEFPLPEYIDLFDDGEREATQEEIKAAAEMKKLARKAKKNKRRK